MADVKKNYTCEDIHMLLAAKTLCLNFKSQKQAFADVKTTWADPFIQNFQERTMNALRKYFNINPDDQPSSVNKSMENILTRAKKNMRTFVASFSESFTNDRDRHSWLWDNLGLAHYWNEDLTTDQQLISLLDAFHMAVTNDIRDEIASEGVSATLINDILFDADQMRDLLRKNSVLKGSIDINDAEGVRELNAIYNECKEICKAGQEIFMHNDEVRPKFDFDGIVKAITFNRPVGAGPTFIKTPPVEHLPGRAG